jgi:plastocyanin
MRRTVAVAAVLALAGLVAATGAVATLGGGAPSALQADDPEADDHDGHGGMEMDVRMVENGTVVNENEDELPPGCEELAGEREVTVRGGVEHSAAGEMFSFERDRLELDPCTAVTVTFVNEDEVRHQWMVHGLSRETYPMGMFNLEVHGPASVTGTFVTPAEDTTLHTHCSLPQHEQKGMAMGVVVGDGGDGHGDDGDNHEH